jgi:ATP-dependent DNA helicase RecG
MSEIEKFIKKGESKTVELERQRRNVSYDEEIDYERDESSIHSERLYHDFHRYTGKKLAFNDLLTLKILKEENKKYYPTIGGLLLAGKENYFEYARIKCARFKGNDVGEFIDQKEFTGPLYEQVESAMKFAQVYIAKGGKVEILQRIDRYEVPLEAVREALVNAVVHRDYSISGSDIKFAIFDDRIEITSPGTLPKTLTIEDILTGRSEIRNRIIARFFKEINLIEQWGTGVKMILHSCKNAGLKQPEFIESGLFFKIIIHKVKQIKNSIPSASRESNLKSIPKSSLKSNLKSVPKNAWRILEIIKKEPAVTIIELADILGLSVSGVKKNISILKKNRLLHRSGAAKGGYWEVIDETI